MLLYFAYFLWSGLPDLNRWPHAPQACALPSCAKPRHNIKSQSTGRSIFPAYMQGGCPQTVSTETDHLDSRYRDIRKIIHATATLGHIYYNIGRESLSSHKDLCEQIDNSHDSCLHKRSDQATREYDEDKHEDKPILFNVLHASPHKIGC